MVQGKRPVPYYRYYSLLGRRQLETAKIAGKLRPGINEPLLTSSRPKGNPHLTTHRRPPFPFAQSFFSESTSSLERLARSFSRSIHSFEAALSP